MNDRPLALIAVGGNVLVPGEDEGTYDQQYTRARALAESLRWMIDDGWRLVVVPGNGPQVSHLGIQQEAAGSIVPPQPLAALDAMSQGHIGSLLTMAIEDVCGEQIGGIATVVTHAEVDADDPAFAAPDKAVGPFYTESEAALFRAARGWAMIEEGSRGHRRVVPSPRPQHFLEAAAISTLVDSGSVVIAAGGGGIPVIRHEDGWRGVDAVIDRDQAAARLAEIIGAQVLVVLTAAANVHIDYGRSSQRPITEMTVTQARGHLAAGQFAAEGMASQVEALGQFVERSRGVAAITTADLLASTLDSRAGRSEEPRGTLIVPEDWRLALP